MLIPKILSRKTSHWVQLERVIRCATPSPLIRRPWTTYLGRSIREGIRVGIYVGGTVKIGGDG